MFLSCSGFLSVVWSAKKWKILSCPYILAGPLVADSIYFKHGEPVRQQRDGSESRLTPLQLGDMIVSLGVWQEVGRANLELGHGEEHEPWSPTPWTQVQTQPFTIYFSFSKLLNTELHLILSNTVNGLNNSTCFTRFWWGKTFCTMCKVTEGGSNIFSCKLYTGVNGQLMKN